MNTMLKQIKALGEYSPPTCLFAHAYCCRFFAFTHSNDKTCDLPHLKAHALFLSFFVKFKRLTSAAMGLKKGKTP